MADTEDHRMSSPGSKKLPSAGRSLGQSMRILMKEVQGLHEDKPESHPSGAQAATTGAARSSDQSTGR
jgi:Sec-independent protein translocase protein TatA